MEVFGINMHECETLAAADKALEEAQASRPATSIGAGLIGEECERKIYYHYNNFPKEPFSAQTLKAFACGHSSEDIIIERLRMVPGIKLLSHTKSGDQFGFRIPPMKGYSDGFVLGLLEAPKTKHVFEAKATNRKKFNQLLKLQEKFEEKEVLKEWNYQYYCQAVTYMWRWKMTRHYTVVATENVREWTSFRTNANNKLARALYAKAVKIADAEEPPERPKKGYHSSEYFACKWCSYVEECHG